MAKLVKGVNDLATLRPDLAAEWNYEKNGDLKPEDVTCGSNKKIWWKCSDNHEWKSRIADRVNGSGCLYCSGRLPIKGKTDLASKNTDLAAEWNYEKNGDLKPEDVTCGSDKKVWWICPRGHEWASKIADRVNGSGCPYCFGRLPIKGETDLASQNPNLAAEWHPSRNGNLTPRDVTCSSAKKAWWQCSEGHEWKATIGSRNSGSGCPYCFGRLPIKGETDLASQNPDLAAEWHPTKNEKLSPEDVTCGSTKKVWWQCSHGHEWKAIIKSRVHGIGCPICSNKQVLIGFNDLASQNPDLAAEWHPTKNGVLSPENVTCGSQKKVWWQCLHGHEWEATIGHRTNNRGCPYCSGRLPIKGKTDLASQKSDLVVEWHPTRNGILTPEDVTCGSSKKIWWKCSYGHEWKSTIDSRVRGAGCPYCSGRLPIKGKTDLASQNPTLAAEWHPTKNGDLTPEDVTCGSDKKVWWQCAEGHEWDTVIKHRTQGVGCPYCSGRLPIKGETDLASQNPTLAAEWHPTKNGDLTPENVTCGSAKRVWWRCSQEHEWETAVKDRINGRSCPYCSGRLPIKGETDLASQAPDLASEWHSTKNGTLTPENVTCSSHKKVWWQCSAGHEWKAFVYNRVKGSGCPYCASSHGEDAVAEVLDDLNVSYLHDKPLGDCFDKGPLRHDFILLSDSNKVVATIEFHGQQHYEPVSFGASEEETKKNFEDGQRRDAIKTQWLKDHNIPQLIIPYWDFDNIEQIIKEFLDSEAVAKSKVSDQDPVYV